MSFHRHSVKIQKSLVFYTTNAFCCILTGELLRRKHLHDWFWWIFRFPGMWLDSKSRLVCSLIKVFLWETSTYSKSESTVSLLQEIDWPCVFIQSQPCWSLVLLLTSFCRMMNLAMMIFSRGYLLHLLRSSGRSLCPTLCEKSLSNGCRLRIPLVHYNRRILSYIYSRY